MKSLYDDWIEVAQTSVFPSPQAARLNLDILTGYAVKNAFVEDVVREKYSFADLADCVIGMMVGVKNLRLEARKTYNLVAERASEIYGLSFPKARIVDPNSKSAKRLASGAKLAALGIGSFGLKDPSLDLLTSAVLYPSANALEDMLEKDADKLFIFQTSLRLHANTLDRLLECNYTYASR